MRRLLAATAAIWSVLAVALVIAIGHRPAATGLPAAAAPVVVIRQANGTLTTVPATTHATTQTSGAAAGSQVVNLTPSAQVAASAPAASAHATTRSS